MVIAKRESGLKEKGFDKITIVGVGLIGGSLAAALRRKGKVKSVTGVDFSPVIQRGLELGLLNAGFPPDRLAEAVSGADLIVLAVPVHQIIDVIKTLGPLVDPGVLITDVGSTKNEIVSAARKNFPPGVFFLGGHPMAGAEKGGIEQADPLLFENAIYVLNENSLVPRDLTSALVEWVESLGAKAVFLSPEQHDRIAAVVSHLPQVLAVTLMNYAAGLNEKDAAYLKLGAGGFRDMTRVASSPYDIWRHILAANKKNIQGAIDDFMEELKRLRANLGKEDAATFFETAARHRLSIPRDTRGFLRPHFDLYVTVQDRPGIIAAIATTLAEAAINIKDIEVVKVREDDAGTIRLALESGNDRARAQKRLKSAGFHARTKD